MKQTMKRVLALVLALVMVAALAACTPSGGNNAGAGEAPWGEDGKPFTPETDIKIVVSMMQTGSTGST